MSFYEVFVLSVNIASVILISLTLHVQFKLKNKYYDNGYVNHRYAFIIGNVGLLISIIMRIFLFITYSNYVVDAMGWFAYILVYILNLSIFVICLIQYYWFKGSNFEIFNFIKRK